MRRRKRSKAPVERRVTTALAVRSGVFALAGAALAYGAFVQAAGAITQTRNPLFALRLNGANPVALATHADRLASGSLDSLKEERGEIIDLAKRSLHGLAINPRALRVLAFGVESAGERDQARKLIGLAHQQSRRDLLTQLWLIEDNVSRENVPQALAHYDIALRANRNAGTVLYPVLAAAIADPALQPSFAPYIKPAAPWLSEFSQYVLEQHTGEPALAELFIRYGRAPNVSTESTLLAQLIAKGHYGLAGRFYASLPEARTAVLTSTGFDADHLDSKFMPVTWQPISAGTAAVAIERGANGQSQFHIAIDANARETTLRKFLMLPAGDYLLSVDQRVATPGSDAEARWELRCLHGDAPATVIGQYTGGPATALTVPAGCAAQYLDLIVSGGTRAETTDITVSKVVLRRR